MLKKYNSTTNYVYDILKLGIISWLNILSLIEKPDRNDNFQDAKLDRIDVLMKDIPNSYRLASMPEHDSRGV